MGKDIDGFLSVMFGIVATVIIVMVLTMSKGMFIATFGTIALGLVIMFSVGDRECK